jgi:hypothetical protein
MMFLPCISLPVFFVFVCGNGWKDWGYGWNPQQYMISPSFMKIVPSVAIFDWE